MGSPHSSSLFPCMHSNTQLLRPMLTLTSTPSPSLPRLLYAQAKEPVPSHRQAYSLPRSTNPNPNPRLSPSPLSSFIDELSELTFY